MAVIERAIKKGVHLLLVGPPGAGKTHAVEETAREMEIPVVKTTGEALQNPVDFAELVELASDKGGVVFVDEIHAMPRQVQEAALTALEEYKMYFPGAVILLPRFVCVAATTNPEALFPPLRERFFRIFIPYKSKGEMVEIVGELCKRMGVIAD
ncbi:MAG: AAA family ATPase, partial [Fimbriimonadales bacterium]